MSMPSVLTVDEFWVNKSCRPSQIVTLVVHEKSFLLEISLSYFFRVDFFLAISYFGGLFGNIDQWVGVLG